MQSHDNPHEHSPKQKRQSADRKQDRAQDDIRSVVILGQPDVYFVLGKIRHVARKSRRVMMHRAPGQNPSHVRPPFAVAWGMWVAMLVRVLVVNAMSRHPENRPTFERQRRTPGKEIFHPLRGLISAMS